MLLTKYILISHLGRFTIDLHSVYWETCHTCKISFIFMVQDVLLQYIEIFLSLSTKDLKISCSFSFINNHQRNLPLCPQCQNVFST